MTIRCVSRLPQKGNYGDSLEGLLLIVRWLLGLAGFDPRLRYRGKCQRLNGGPEENGVKILERWRKRELLDCCPGETVTWILDLLGFDLLRMDESERSATCKSLAAELSVAFGPK